MSASSPRWALLPLRLFLGFTMLYAALHKLTDPTFFDPESPTSVQAELERAASGRPLSPIVEVLLGQPTLAGWGIALGELAVGISLLLGLWTRVGAVGGALLSLSFLLTVSWGTTPYFYNPDIAYLVAFITLALAGDGGMWSISAWLSGRRSRG